MREAIASAPGKVNLILRSAAAGPDKYHELFTVFEAISLREYVVARTRRQPGIGVQTLVYRPAVGSEAPVFSPDLTEEMAALPTSQHLAVKAAKILQPLAAATSWGPNSSGLQLTVHKTIPAAGGMAGGSADAAAALVAVNQLWQLGLTPEQLLTVGRNLGADVPACLLGGQSLGVGRGDHLTPLEAPSQQHWWALAFADQGLSTPAVFKEFDALELGAAQLPRELANPEALGGLAETLAGHLRNDLAQAALSLRPALAEVGSAALEAGALAWMISGSGPTVAALTATEEAARRVCGQWQGQPGVAGTAVAWGPVPGALIEDSLPDWHQQS